MGPLGSSPALGPTKEGNNCWQVSGRAWEAGGAVGPKALGDLLAGCLLGRLAGSGQEGSETPAGNILHPRSPWPRLAPGNGNGKQMAH